MIFYNNYPNLHRNVEEYGNNFINKTTHEYFAEFFRFYVKRFDPESTSYTETRQTNNLSFALFKNSLVLIKLLKPQFKYVQDKRLARETIK